MNKHEVRSEIGEGFTKEQAAIMAELLANITLDEMSYLEAESMAFRKELAGLMESVRDGNKPSSDALPRMIAIALSDMQEKIEAIQFIQKDVDERAIDK